jgi:predicted nucleotidyltransferase
LVLECMPAMLEALCLQPNVLVCTDTYTHTHTQLDLVLAESKKPEEFRVQYQWALTSVKVWLKDFTNAVKIYFGFVNVTMYPH